MKIAVVGSGISGLVTARLLSQQHDVTLLEANGYPGGHTNTVNVDYEGESYAVDTGFIVYNDWTYPNLIGFLDQLGVKSKPTEMGFSVRCDRCGLQYNGSSFSGLFVQKRNLLRPSFLRMLSDITRFNKQASLLFEELQDHHTVGQFLETYRYSEGFAEHYLLPMGAAIWSCPMKTFKEFPVKFIIEFYKNHGLLQIRNRPVWRVVEGGSKTYVDEILKQSIIDLRLNNPVHKIVRNDEHVSISHSGSTELFDEVVIACHSDTALQLLDEPTRAESEVLRGFPYGKNVAVLHNDESILPARPAWASWNYHLKQGEETRPSVTYNMNILQGLKSSKPFCVTLNEEETIQPDLIHARFEYSHPVFTTERRVLQQRHGELIRESRTSFCGAYWGNGFHEDGVVSALRVCREFGISPEWSTLKPDKNSADAKGFS